MVIGLLILSSIPVVTGVGQGYSAQKASIQRQKDEHRMRKAHINVYCDARSSRTNEVHGKRLALRDGKVYISDKEPKKRKKEAYTMEAFYIEYPDPDRKPMEMGFVSQVSDDPPLLNWIYVVEASGEVRYGNRSESKSEVVGPWDWTEDEVGVTLMGEEGFVAVESEVGGEWEVWFEVEEGWLRKKLGPGRKMLQISLERSHVPVVVPSEIG